jgi:hypothetical protein
MYRKMGRGKVQNVQRNSVLSACTIDTIFCKYLLTPLMVLMSHFLHSELQIVGAFEIGSVLLAWGHVDALHV